MNRKDLVLVVDDDPEVADTHVRMLKKLAATSGA